MIIRKQDNGEITFDYQPFSRSKSVGFEVNSSEDFKEKETRSDDRFGLPASF